MARHSIRRPCALAWLLAVSFACTTESDAPQQVGPEDAEGADCSRLNPICNPTAADTAPPDAMVSADVLQPPTAECADGVDNDDDGQIDLDDLGCYSVHDNDESDDPPAAACGDGLDNDTDGFVDFPEDPGCGSNFDDDETDSIAPMPQCSDGIDNDADGLFDLGDPGCVSPADPNENDPPEPPPCANLLDDDNDGLIDFPRDPGCSSAGDDNEEDLAVDPRCANGIDDDDDGRVDYPDDPGCSGLGDRDETDPPVPPPCSDGQDNDRDGLIDFPDDRGCESAADESEAGSCGRMYNPIELTSDRIYQGDTRGGRFGTEASCGGRGAAEVAFVYLVERTLEALVISTDHEDTQMESTLYVRTACLDENTEVACLREPLNDGESRNTLRLERPPTGELYIYVDGATGHGGRFALSITEVPLAECLNGRDDDDDGLADYPHDPGCERAEDREEIDPPDPPLCADDRDNDGDGLVDFPLDLGCEAAADNDEVDECGQGVRIYAFPVDQGFVIDDTSRGASNAYTGSCGGAGTPEKVFRYRNPINAQLNFTVDHPETVNNTLLYVRSDCLRAQTEIDCDVGEPPQSKGSVEVPRASVGEYYVVVDHPFGLGGAFKLSVEVIPLEPGCVDGFDNDGDGFTDADDIGCEGPDDQDESDPPPDTPAPICADGEDNDGDGLIDFPFDLGCSARGDQDETDSDELPECANGLDDDGDGRTDFPIDPGCQARGDASEHNSFPLPECANGRDDDGDGPRDYPEDPGCASAGDREEANPPFVPQCADGQDNDRDGVIDFPFDPGCFAASANEEADPAQMPVCSNGEDDDDDGRVDFPWDSGCRYAADPDETSPRFEPQCANERDDDQDDRIDFPDDRGCRFAADSDERDEYDPAPRCSDGVDNEGDGQIDLQDVGCLGPEDDDETDPDEIPACGNGVDDDEDDMADWPDDPGCRARGDLAEDQSCRLEVEPLLIEANGTVVGSTAEDGADYYHTRCGGRQSPDAVFEYRLEQPATLRISADNPGTDYPVVLSVRNDCEEPDAVLACAGDFRTPEPTLTLRDAEPGEYYIFVDGGGPEQWISSGRPINLPPDPRGFVARQDLQPNCWSDGGNDAFDCYGNTDVTFGDATLRQIEVSLGQRVLNAGEYAFSVESDFPHANVWRMRFNPQEELDDRRVSLSITGNLGSDGSTRSEVRRIEFDRRNLSFLYTTDGGPNDPPVHHVVVPSDPEDIPRISYATQGDNVTILAAEVKLPVVFYVALSYAPDPNAVVLSVLNDVEVRAGAGGGDAPRHGNFELSVEEQ